MSIKRKITAAAAAMLLMTGIAVASGTTPAFAASGHETCDDGLPVKCINAWGGGPDIKVYSPNVANNNFTIQGVNRCNNGDYTTSNCPIAGNPSGLFIYQIKFSGGGAYNGRCVGDNDTIGYAHLVNCNSTSYPGTGGGTATIFVQFHGDGNTLGFCSTSFNYAINSHFTIQGGGWVTGITGIEWDQEQNGLLVALSAGVPTCLVSIPFG
jgi:hypothetical protein